MMKMLVEANKALGPLSFIKDDLNSCKGLFGRVPVVLHPSLYRFHEPDRWRPDPSYVQSGHSNPCNVHDEFKAR